ncbi:unnamed protein product, partial [marine sediment metagenome]
GYRNFKRLRRLNESRKKAEVTAKSSASKIDCLNKPPEEKRKIIRKP